MRSSAAKNRRVLGRRNDRPRLLDAAKPGEREREELESVYDEREEDGDETDAGLERKTTRLKTERVILPRKRTTGCSSS